MKVVRPFKLPNGCTVFNLRLSENVIINGFRWNPSTGKLSVPRRCNAKGKWCSMMTAPGWWYKRVKKICARDFGIALPPAPPVLGDAL